MAKITRYKELNSSLSGLEKQLQTIAQKTADDVASRSPVQTGIYRSGWAVRVKDDKAIVYNKNKPSLTHLLEDGHQIVTTGQSRGTGKTFAKPIPHIRPAYQAIKPEFQQKMKNWLLSELNK